MSASAHPAPAPIRQPAPPGPGPVPVPLPVHPKPPRRWLVPTALVFMGLLGGALYLMLKPTQAAKTGSSDLVRSARAVSGTLDRVVRVAGQTSARNYAAIMVPVFRGGDSGRELTLTKLAGAGSYVKKGDTVAELDAQMLKDRIDDREDQVQQGENDVLKKKAEQDVERESMQQNLRVAKADLDKAKLDLSAGEVRTEIERELLKLSADEADAAYKQLLRDVAFKNAADAAELRILEITVQRQNILLNRHRNDLRRFTMTSPMDGLVVMTQTFRQGQTTQIQLGDNVHAGQPIMKIVDTNSMQVEALVSQADSSEFRVGQEASVGLDAFPGLQLHGKVYSIGALAVKGMWDTYYIRNVPVRIAIEGRDSRVIPDLSAWAHVRVGAGEANAIILPREAVRTQGGQNVVYVKGEKGFEKRVVELGLKTTTQVAVLSGVKAGEEVATSGVN